MKLKLYFAKSKERIIQDIDRITHADPASYTIGITYDEEKRKGEHKASGKDVKQWQAWKAKTQEDAQEIEKHFLAKRLKGGTGGDQKESTVFVYIF
jgi:hypothetical protein